MLCSWDIKALIEFQKHTNGVRLGVVHNPSAPGGASTKLKISSAIQVALDTLSPNMAKSFITKLLKEENVEALFNGEKSLEDLAVGVRPNMFNIHLSIIYLSIIYLSIIYLSIIYLSIIHLSIIYLSIHSICMFLNNCKK